MTGKCLTSVFILPLCFEIQFPCYYYEICVFPPKKSLNVEMLVILGVTVLIQLEGTKLGEIDLTW